MPDRRRRRGMRHIEIETEIIIKMNSTLQQGRFFFDMILYHYATIHSETPAILVVGNLSATRKHQCPCRLDRSARIARPDRGRIAMGYPAGSCGSLERAEVISFRPGDDWGVHNFTRRILLGNTRYDQGRILFSDQAALSMRELLVPQRANDGVRSIAAIFIDAGHGGKDPGTVGTHVIDDNQFTLYEKDIVLSIAVTLRDLLHRHYPDKQIILSRDTDVYHTLEERTKIANSIHAGPSETIIFISIHANASLNDKATGFEVWYLPPNYRRRNLVSASDTGVDDPDVLAILNTIKEEEYTIESVLLARNISDHMQALVGAISPNRGIKQESWYVVRQAKMPSVLVELGFVTNRDEALRLTNPDYLQSLSSGIYNGTVSFIDDFER